MAENPGDPLDQRARRGVRLAVVLVALAVMLGVVLVVFIGKVDGQARAVRDDLDQSRLRQYGVVAR